MDTPSPDRDTLLNFLHGKLSDAESEQIAQLVENDPELQQQLEELDHADDTFIEMLRQDHEDTPTEGYDDYSEALQEAKNLFQHDPRQILGEYELLERIGQGGMGVVFKARHRKLGRTVAVKVIADARAGDERAIARFEREIKTIGQLDHPSIVHAHDAREIDGRSILVMEYVDGMDLGRLIRRHGPVSVADACELIRQTAIGLQAAHELGLVHRDIKPSNLMLDRQGNLKILDLGLAREVTDLQELQREVSMSFDLTQTGQAMGTADYMAPEQADHPELVDIRADIYSAGCTLFKLLTGRAPYHEEMTFDKLSAHAEMPLPPTPDLPDALRAILDRMTAKNPDDRFATPSEVADALTPFCANHDLTALLTRAESQTAPALTLPRTSSGGRFRRVIIVLLALAFFGGLGFFGGIILTIHRNGKETKLEIPDGAQAKVDAKGDVTVNLASSDKSASATSAPKGNHFSINTLDPRTEAERRQLIGKWRAVATNKDGLMLDLPDNIKSELTISKNHIEWLTPTNQKLTFQFTIDPTPNPKRLTLKLVSDTPREWKLYAIYKIEYDTLTLCYDENRFPRDFTQTSFLSVFKRAKATVNENGNVALDLNKETPHKEPRPVVADKKPLAQQAAPSPTKPLDENRKELQKFIGRWRLAAFTTKGKALPMTDDAKSRKLELVFEARYFKTLEDGKELDITPYHIDTTTTPKRIRWSDGNNYTYGIYKFEGDQLTICEKSLGGKGYPTSFADTSTSTRHVWQRVTPTEPPLSENEKERQRLIGTWKIVSVKENGQIGLKRGTASPLKLTITKDRIEWPTYPEDKIPVKANAQPFIIDITSTPKRISWPFGLENMSIYKLEGDQLTICSTNPDRKGSPTDFVSEKDSTNNVLMVFEREKATKKKTKPVTNYSQNADTSIADTSFSENTSNSSKNAGTNPAANRSSGVQLEGVWKLVERPNREGCLLFGGEEGKMPEVTAIFTGGKFYLRGKEIVNRQFSYEISPDEKNINLLDGRNQVYRGVISWEKRGKQLVLVFSKKERPTGSWEYFGTDYDRLVLEKTDTKPYPSTITFDKSLLKKWFLMSTNPQPTPGGSSIPSHSLARRFTFCDRRIDSLSYLASATFSEEGHLTFNKAPAIDVPDERWPKRFACDIDPLANPKRLDVAMDDKTVFKGIYKIEGDRLHVRFTMKENYRPKDFQSPVNNDLVELEFASPAAPTPELVTILITEYGIVFDGHYVTPPPFQSAIPVVANELKKYSEVKVVLASSHQTSGLINFRRTLLDAGVKSVQIKAGNQPNSYQPPIGFCLLKYLPVNFDIPADKIQTLHQQLPKPCSVNRLLRGMGEMYHSSGNPISKKTKDDLLTKIPLWTQEVKTLPNAIRVKLAPEIIKQIQGGSLDPEEKVAIVIDRNLIIAVPTLGTLQKGSFEINYELTDEEQKILVNLLKSAKKLEIFGNGSGFGGDSIGGGMF